MKYLRFHSLARTLLITNPEEHELEVPPDIPDFEAENLRMAELEIQRTSLSERTFDLPWDSLNQEIKTWCPANVREEVCPGKKRPHCLHPIVIF